MSKRLAGALLLVVVALLGAGGQVALATEAASEAEGARAEVNIDELRRDPISGQFVPPEQEPPAFFRFISYPLVIAGVIVAALLLLAYLVWQPRFAEERRSRRRR